MHRRAKETRKFFLLFLISEINPKIGARIINSRLAEEFATPRISVLVLSETTLA